MNSPTQFISSDRRGACAGNLLLPGFGRSRRVNNKEKLPKPHKTFVTATKPPCATHFSKISKIALIFGRRGVNGKYSLLKYQQNITRINMIMTLCLTVSVWDMSNYRLSVGISLMLQILLFIIIYMPSLETLWSSICRKCWKLKRTTTLYFSTYIGIRRIHNII